MINCCVFIFYFLHSSITEKCKKKWFMKCISLYGCKQKIKSKNTTYHREMQIITIHEMQFLPIVQLQIGNDSEYGSNFNIAQAYKNVLIWQNPQIIATFGSLNPNQACFFFITLKFCSIADLMVARFSNLAK